MDEFTEQLDRQYKEDLAKLGEGEGFIQLKEEDLDIRVALQTIQDRTHSSIVSGIYIYLYVVQQHVSCVDHHGS